MEVYIGLIMLFAGNFPPRNWAFCQGQYLDIASYSTLYSILGTTYGGNGRTDFALPNLAGRCAIGAGSSPGLTPRRPGQIGGWERNTMDVTHMPAHTHIATTTTTGGTVTLPCVTTSDADSNSPENNFLAGTGLAGAKIYHAGPSNAAMGGGGTVDVNVEVNNQTTGGSQPLENMQPFLALNYIIALEGLYPPRS